MVTIASSGPGGSSDVQHFEERYVHQNMHQIFPKDETTYNSVVKVGDLDGQQRWSWYALGPTKNLR